MRICGRGHQIRGPHDKLRNGQCRHCHRENLKSYNQRRALGLSILRTAESRGMTAEEAVRVLADAPVELLRHLELLDPWLMKVVRERIAELVAERELANV